MYSFRGSVILEVKTLPRRVRDTRHTIHTGSTVTNTQHIQFIDTNENFNAIDLKSFNILCH